MTDFDALCRKARTDPSAALALREAYLRRAFVGALVLPGLACRLGRSTLVGPVTLTALRDAACETGLDAHRHGAIVWASGGAELMEGVLATLRVELPGHLKPAAVLGYGEVVIGPEADLHGVEVEHIRKLLPHARPSELLCTPDAGTNAESPEGVGRFGAPKAIVEATGLSAIVWRDYR